VVDVTSPVSEKVVTFAPTVATSPKDVPSVERWIVKPVSLLELSVHDNLILDADAAMPVRLLGAAGVAVAVGDGVGVGVGVGVGEGGEVGSPKSMMLGTDGTPFPFRMKSMW